MTRSAASSTASRRHFRNDHFLELDNSRTHIQCFLDQIRSLARLRVHPDIDPRDHAPPYVDDAAAMRDRSVRRARHARCRRRSILRPRPSGRVPSPAPVHLRPPALRRGPPTRVGHQRRDPLAVARSAESAAEGPADLGTRESTPEGSDRQSPPSGRATGPPEDSRPPPGPRPSKRSPATCKSSKLEQHNLRRKRRPKAR